jgi:nicotinamide mononucleotide (NMN) deamidase PncC
MENLEHISDYLDRHTLRLVTAESCTAGLVIAKLGDMPGCGSADGIPVFEHQGTTVVFSETRHFDGDRNAIRKAGADYAIQRIVFYHRQLLEGSMPSAP